MMMINRRRVCGGKSLPYDAEIEYIDSNLSKTNRNCIDTGIVPYNNHTMRFITSVMFNSTQRRVIISNYIDGGTPVCSLELQTQNNTERLRTYSANGTGGSISNISTISLPANEYIDVDATIDFDNKKWYITFSFSGNEYTFNNNAYDTKYNCATALLLFLDHRRDISLIAYPLKMKFMKIIVDDVLTRNYIPVRVGNVGYLYDKVSSQLFGNAGSGSFILGPDK